MKIFDTKAASIIDECSSKAQEGTIDFGTVVKNLIAAGIESYFVDYRKAQSTYYLASGDSYTKEFMDFPDTEISSIFDDAAVREAIRGAQSGTVKYPEFLEKTLNAGCVGYFVWIEGRNVQYYGRKGERHTENFPA